MGVTYSTFAHPCVRAVFLPMQTELRVAGMLEEGLKYKRGDLTKLVKVGALGRIRLQDQGLALSLSWSSWMLGAHNGLKEGGLHRNHGYGYVRCQK